MSSGSVRADAVRQTATSPRPATLGAAPAFNVLGTRISALTLELAVRLLAERVESREPGYVCVCTVNDIVESLKKPEVRRSINGAWLATTDGMPLVWWGRLSGHRWITRVYGPDILRAVLADPQHRRTRHFFYGGTPEVLARLEAAARRLNPELALAGAIAPPFRPLTPAEEYEHLRAMNEASPDIIWVGLGCPKQNLWMVRMRPRLEAPLLIGVGAAFDFLAGVKPQAPSWMQRAGLEWLFRLLCEPRRLWRRYLVNNTIFLAHAFAYWSGLRPYPLDTPASAMSGEGRP